MLDQNRDSKITSYTERWVCPSTLAYWEEAKQTPGFSRMDLLHGYIYSRWPYFYIGVAIGEHPMTGFIRTLVRLISFIFGPGSGGEESASGSAETYHGKVLTREAARQLVSVKQDIVLTDLEKVVPYSQARDIILKNPDHIVALECPCRASRPDPCQPLDVCLIIGEPFAGFVAEHQPERSRWIDSDTAARILEDEHHRGHVQHAIFKDAMFGRFYAICNCCSCCCGAMQAMRNGTPMLAASGYRSVVDRQLCIACGDCVGSCPFAAIELLDHFAQVDPLACMGCGVCVTICETTALTLIRDRSKGDPLEIMALLDQEQLAA